MVLNQWKKTTLVEIGNQKWLNKRTGGEGRVQARGQEGQGLTPSFIPANCVKFFSTSITSSIIRTCNLNVKVTLFIFKTFFCEDQMRRNMYRHKEIGLTVDRLIGSFLFNGKCTKSVSQVVLKEAFKIDSTCTYGISTVLKVRCCYMWESQWGERHVFNLRELKSLTEHISKSLLSLVMTSPTPKPSASLT